MVVTCKIKNSIRALQDAGVSMSDEAIRAFKNDLESHDFMTFCVRASSAYNFGFAINSRDEWYEVTPDDTIEITLREPPEKKKQFKSIW